MSLREEIRRILRWERGAYLVTPVPTRGVPRGRVPAGWDAAASWEICKYREG